jgi:hypothetical protein
MVAMNGKALWLAALLGASALPPGVAPLPASLAQHLEELLHRTEAIRGLHAKHPVAAGIVAEEDLPARIADALRSELPAEELRTAETALKVFGLLPERLDLAGYYPALLSSEVAGFYDPERRYLALVRRGGEESSGGLQDMILVHELTHALQDQEFDLQRFQGDPLSDEVTARAALVEGDASLVMLDFLADEPSAAPDPPASHAMDTAPPWLRDTLQFGYVDGYLFCRSVVQKGGLKLLDTAFRDDPPRSSEQILHPEKWHTERDDPIVLAWPDLAGRLPGVRKLAEGQLGELGIGILLRGSHGRADAEAAAAGWGGDRFAVYEKDGRRLLAWITEWDSAADAREFRTAARWLGRGWKIAAPAGQPRRILLLRGPWTRSEAKGVRAALAAIPAGRR